MATNTIYTIENGPSKFDFMQSLFDGKVIELTIKKYGNINKHIQTDSKNKVKARFFSVTTEDGSNESWITHIYVGKERIHYTAYYSTRNRKGAISIPNKETTY